ncbi:MAG: hypothetical protein OXC02_03255 [Rhodobacteraceae bacterium]|nr:hypothetical protein [Paracoccaceae bacterium]
MFKISGEYRTFYALSELKAVKEITNSRQCIAIMDIPDHNIA